MKVAILGTRFGEPTIEAAGLRDYDVSFVLDPGGDGDAIVAAAQDASVIMAGGAPRFPAAVLARLPNLHIIVRLGVGVETIDLEAATALGITVANVPDYASEEVSTHTVALILALVRKLVPANQTVRRGGWGLNAVRPLFSLADQTIGIIGFGQIGRAVTRKLRPFGSTLLVHDPYVAADVIAEAGATAATVDAILEAADIITLNAPLTDGTYHLIDAAALARMKSTAFLVNTSRGGLIDEVALLAALEAGAIAGAALDVLEQEPAAPGNPLVQREDVIVTPHMAWYTVQGTRRMREFAVIELARMLDGHRPRNFVNPAVWGAPQQRMRIAPAEGSA